MKFFSVRLLIPALFLLNLNGCSIIGGFFPDKERDYQLSSELPELKIPADITNKGLKKKQSSNQTEDTEKLSVSADAVKTTPAAGTATSVVVTEQIKEEPTHVKLVKFENGETRLQINKPVAMSWRIVGKALSHKTIEITGRDQANAEFTVQYDPNETDFTDESIWDEFIFVFAEDHSQEKPYHLKLLARDKGTEIVVLDEQGKPLDEAGGLSLLKLLLTAIEADLADE